MQNDKDDKIIDKINPKLCVIFTGTPPEIKLKLREHVYLSRDKKINLSK